METGSPIAQCSNAHQRRLSLLIADAIVAAYARRQSDPTATQEEQGKSAVPIIYNFIDYLLIALPEQAELLIGHPELHLALSTETGLLVSMSSHEMQAEGIPFGTAGVIWIIIRSDGNKTESCSQSVSELLLCVMEVAKARGGKLAERLPEHLASALAYLVEHFKKVDTAPTLRTFPPIFHSPVDINDGVLDGILQRTCDHIGTALTIPYVDFTFAMRYWINATPEILAFEYIRAEEQGGSYLLRKCALKSGGQKQVRAVFRSGFARWCCPAPGRVLVSIPCHLGGVPWLVACRDLPCGERPQLWAYTVYRDHSLLNGALRHAGRTAIASEMRRLFGVAATRPGRTAEEARQCIQQSWLALMRIYPIRQPLLHESDRSLQNEEHDLPLLGKRYRVSFENEPNPFLTGPVLPDSDDTEQWGPIGQQELHRSFTMPLRSELKAAQTRLNAALAENVYAIGHPLKHRLGRVRQAVDTELEALNIEPFDRQDAKYHCQRARLFTHQVECTAETMDLMANLSQHNCDVTQLESKFLSVVPYMVGSRVRSLLDYFAAAESALEITDSELSELDRLVIVPTIPTEPQHSRLFNTFYNDIFFELLVNADRHCPPQNRRVHIHMDHVGDGPHDDSSSQQCITITNATLQRTFERLRLQTGEWTAWRTDQDGPKGGLRLLAGQLHLTGVGGLLARPMECNDTWWFSVAVRLAGLRREAGTDTGTRHS